MATSLPSETLATEIPAETSRQPASLGAEALRRFRRHRLATFGAAALVFMVLAVLAGPFV